MANANKSVNKYSRLLLIGFAFFINPVPLGLDIIPDVFGCALIFIGLTRLAYFDGAVENARKNMFYLLIVEAVKLLMTRSIISTDIGSNRMLAVTAFSIVEGILYVIFFRQFFGGVAYYSMRNNCNKALAKCDGSAFLSYLSFFVRMAATLLPELLALVELEKEFATDFETIDTITSIMAAKPLLVVLLSLVALVTGVAWFVSISNLILSFRDEASETLDARYREEYSSRPEAVRPKKLRNGSAIIYIALFFAADIVFDGIRIIPASVMFLMLWFATLILGDFSDFSPTRRLCLPAFALFIGAEAFKAVFVPNGALVIYETDLWIVLVGAAIALVAVPMALLCVRSFLADVRKLSASLGGSDISTTVAWVSYSVTVTLWTAGYVVPYFYSYVSTLRFFAACVFIWQTAKLITQINDEENERFSLYGGK